MTLKLYNTLTKKIDELSPISDNLVRVYSCGPTVYDHIHIGNLSSFIYVDTLTKLLKIDGHDVSHVMNITDVDDKMIKRSREESPDDSPEIALNNLSKKYETTFFNDMLRVGNQVEAINFIRATESIGLMQNLITELLDEDFAYIAEDGIYFSIEKYKSSGKKYGQLLELDSSNTSRARINNDEYDKESVHDFALWKFMLPNEPAWSFVIDGKDYIGRPGWHIECSAMSTNKLGQPFDIHTGGIDLIFPHHENEIAQSTAGKENSILANVFFHNEHLLVNKKKMSKSLGNVINLNDIIERKIDPIAFRLLILQSHYRSQANFSWDLLESASARLTNLRNFAILRFQTNEKSVKAIDFNEVTAELKDILYDDLNLPQFLAKLSDIISVIEVKLIPEPQLGEFNAFIKFLDSVLGLNLMSLDDIDDEEKNLIKKREELRNAKNWEESDKIREELISKNITINDSEFGQIWSRV